MNKEQLWQQKAGDIVVLGLTPELQDEAGDMAYVDIAPVGRIEEGETILVVEASKSAIEIPSPISGTIISKNKSAEQVPEELNLPDQADNWIVKIDVSN